MKAEIKITVEINGKEEIISYDDARKLYDELGKIFAVPAIRFDPPPWKWPDDWYRPSSPVVMYGIR